MPPARRKKLSMQVMESIQQMIVDQHLAPGDLLPTENQISEKLEVCKSSVREAIKMLEALGVVEIRRGLCTIISETPQKGFYNLLQSQLCLYGNRAQADLLGFCRAMESACAVQAIQVATPQDLSLVRLDLEQFRKKVETGALDADDGIRFRIHLVEAAHNSFLLPLAQSLYLLFRESISCTLRQDPQKSLRLYERIYQALQERDLLAVTQAMGESAEGWTLSSGALRVPTIG